MVLDTNYLADFLAIFYENNVSTGNLFSSKYRVGVELCKKINKIITCYSSYATLEEGLIVASSFAFVELARQFDLIVNKRFSLEQFKAFIDQPPTWFLIDSLNCNLIDSFYNVPAYIDYNGNLESMEWTDAIHVAVAESREPLAFIACSDHKIQSIESLNNRIIT